MSTGQPSDGAKFSTFYRFTSPDRYQQVTRNPLKRPLYRGERGRSRSRPGKEQREHAPGVFLLPSGSEQQHPANERQGGARVIKNELEASICLLWRVFAQRSTGYRKPSATANKRAVHHGNLMTESSTLHLTIPLQRSGLSRMQSARRVSASFMIRNWSRRSLSGASHAIPRVAQRGAVHGADLAELAAGQLSTVEDLQNLIAPNLARIIQKPRGLRSGAEKLDLGQPRLSE